MKNTKLIFSLSGLLLFCTTAFAHPPSDIKIRFNDQTKTLSASVIHHVSNPKTHYIYKVDIGLNGKEIKTLTFKRQTNKGEQRISLAVPEVKPGDLLSVEGYCNLSGKLKKEIKVK